jgi:secretion/DNA translocation related TadE-like protein
VDVGGERGAGTVLVLAVVLLLAATTWVGTAVSAVVVARHAAARAADLAALAAAAEAWAQPGTACRTAAAVAAGNRARLVQCRVDGADALVTVETRAGGWAARVGPIRRSAHAGLG